MGEAWLVLVVDMEACSEAQIVAIAEVVLDRVVAVEGMKVAFAGRIAAVDWVAGQAEGYVATVGMSDCTGVEIFCVDPQVGLWGSQESSHMTLEEPVASVVVAEKKGQFRNVNCYSDEKYEHSHWEVVTLAGDIDYLWEELVEEEVVVGGRCLSGMGQPENMIVDCSLA